jgi:uroporphyrinogen-III synthase
VLAAASSPEAGGVVDRLLAHLRGLVQVRVLSETQGDDPAALVSQIEAESRRGDVSGALAAFAKLPEPARQAASGWAAEAGAKQAADEALSSIREAAIAKLAAAGKS